MTSENASHLAALPDTVLDRIGRRLARKLNSPISGYKPFTHADDHALCRTLKPGDILLVEGRERISNAIKYLTQSTWSHAALYVGDMLPGAQKGAHMLVEVNLGTGCVASPLSKYTGYNTRICRPVGLPADQCRIVVRFMIDHLGVKYDHRNIFDLARYFLPTPPVPVRWRRRMIAFGAGDPTRAICSSLIAQAFQSIRYPILPDVAKLEDGTGRREVLHIRHHALFAPRDFDLSPYFEVIKPHLTQGFDHRTLHWAE